MWSSGHLSWAGPGKAADWMLPRRAYFPRFLHALLVSVDQQILLDLALPPSPSMRPLVQCRSRQCCACHAATLCCCACAPFPPVPPVPTSVRQFHTPNHVCAAAPAAPAPPQPCSTAPLRVQSRWPRAGPPPPCYLLQLQQRSVSRSWQSSPAH